VELFAGIAGLLSDVTAWHDAGHLRQR